MNKLRIILDRTLEIAIALLMLALLIDVVWQVFSRYILDDPSSITDELARYLLIWVSLLGASYISGKNLHLSIDLLPEKFKTSFVRIFIQVSIGLFALFALGIGGFNLVSLTLDLNQISAALQVKLGYIYLVLPLSGSMILLYSILNSIEILRISDS